MGLWAPPLPSPSPLPTLQKEKKDLGVAR